MRDFRKYDIWIDGIDFSIEVYGITDAFPSDERFGLSSQMRRAAVSIASNIAEGASRKSNIEFSRFIEILLGSSFELETQLIIALKRNYILARRLRSCSRFGFWAPSGKFYFIFRYPDSSGRRRLPAMAANFTLTKIKFARFRLKPKSRTSSK